MTRGSGKKQQHRLLPGALSLLAMLVLLAVPTVSSMAQVVVEEAPNPPAITEEAPAEEISPEPLTTLPPAATTGDAVLEPDAITAPAVPLDEQPLSDVTKPTRVEGERLFDFSSLWPKMLTSLAIVVGLMLAFFKWGVPALQRRYPRLFATTAQDKPVTTKAGTALAQTPAADSSPLALWQDTRFHVLSSTKLGQNLTLYLIQIKTAQLVLSVTPSHVSLLTEFRHGEEDDLDSAVDEMLEDGTIAGHLEDLGLATDDLPASSQDADEDDNDALQDASATNAIAHEAPPVVRHPGIPGQRLLSNKRPQRRQSVSMSLKEPFSLDSLYRKYLKANTPESATGQQRPATTATEHHAGGEDGVANHHDEQHLEDYDDHYPA